MITLTPANRYQVLGQFGQPITYASKLNEGVWASGYTVANVFWEDVTQLDTTTSPDLLFQQTRIAHVWTSQLSGYVVSGVQVAPKLDDRLTDNQGAIWYASQVTPNDWDGTDFQRYVCRCYLGT